MMGVSPHQSRNDLLREITTGIAPEFDPDTLARMADGHAAEEAARVIVEGYLKAPLLPLTCLTDDEYLLASFDGINEEMRVGWEHKIWNEKLAAQIRAKTLDPFYYWQLEAQAAVGVLDYIIFTCSDGTREWMVHYKYVPVPGRREALLASWAQFDADLAEYVHQEVLPPVTAAPVMALPALSIRVSIENGLMVLTDNIEGFGADLKAFIARFPEKLTGHKLTDQEVVDRKAACKTDRKS